jgi:hypothetical protein
MADVVIVAATRTPIGERVSFFFERDGLYTTSIARNPSAFCTQVDLTETYLLCQVTNLVPLS